MSASRRPIPSLSVTPDRSLPLRYADAAEDFNPIHVDPEFARSVGLPSNILHGLYGMGLMARHLVATAGEGDPRNLRSLSVQFRAMGFPEREIIIEGDIGSVDGDLVVKATATQGESPLIRNAEARLLTRSSGPGARPA